jgi:hypothetical protein
MNWLPWVFWILAIVGSGLYAAFGVAIFARPGDSPPRPWLWHQRWLYFLGSIVGWLAAWLVFLRHCGWPVHTCGGEPGWWDVIGGLTAFIGMTGYLPTTVLGLVTGARALGTKAADLVAKLLPKIGGA